MIFRTMALVFFLSSVIFANTYYIDYSTGADSNPGTSKSTPWKRSPGMNGFAATYTHSPGDIFVFKGGVVWPSAALPFTISYSGTAGNVDTYTTDHSWYAGPAWSQPTLDGQLFQKTLLSASEKSHVRINDLRMINAGMVAANGIIAFRFSNCSYFEISNNTLAPQSWGCLYVITERTGDFSDFFVHNNDISACAFGMRFVPGAPGSIMHNVQVYNNDIHDFHSQLSGQVHGDGIQCYNTPDIAASYDRYVDGFRIFNNRFYGDFSQVAGSGGAMTALIYLSGATKGVEIYNNLFAPQFSGSQSPNFFESFISLRDNPNRGGYHKIYNNTFVTPVASGQAAAILEDDTRYPSPGLDIKNNIFSNFNWPFDLRSTNHTIDYNNIQFVRDVGKWAGNFVGSLANWQALGLDIHGISANPQFVSSTDFHLSPTSPCKGIGDDLSTVVATDLDGNSRPGSAGFSFGAFEYGAAPPLTSPTLTPTPSPLPLPSTSPSPVLWWPGNGATGIVSNPSLTWSPDAAALSYTVQVSTASSFATTVRNQAEITSTEYEAIGLANSTTYYWRVNAITAAGTTDWSQTGSFTTVAAPAIPSTIALWWPANEATEIVINPSLTWSPQTDALSYTVQVSTVSSFATTVRNEAEITSTEYEAIGLSNNTTYYWRVKTQVLGGTTDWSQTGTFTTVAAPMLPSTTVLWWPANGATEVVIDPSLTWSPDTAVLSYGLQVSTDSSFASTVINQADITQSSFEATGLSAAKAYYWRVNFTKAGGSSMWSPAAKFTTIELPVNAFIQDTGANGLVSIEAEHFAKNISKSGHTWEQVYKSGYSGGGAMQVLPNNGAGINTGYALTSPQMDYPVYFHKTGAHYIWVRGIGLSGNDDSFHAGINSAEVSTCDRISSFSTNWTWSKTDMEGKSAYFTVSDAGEHTVNIWMREDGFIIDKIVITTNPNYVPTETGPLENRIGGLGKELTAVRLTNIQPITQVAGINSCRNGVVQISLPASGAYQLSIYTLGGQIAGEISGEIATAGNTTVSLRGLTISTGFYLMRLSAKGIIVNRKIYVSGN